MSYSFTRIIDLEERPVPEEFKIVSVTVRDPKTGYVVTRDKNANSSKSVLDLYQEATQLLEKATRWDPSPGAKVVHQNTVWVALVRTQWSGGPTALCWERLEGNGRMSNQDMLGAWLSGDVETGEGS